jgi:hypothetical protein
MTPPTTRTAVIILAIMTALCFGGPFGVKWILSGGIERGWPPDRPVEWIALFGTCGLVLAMMVVLLAMNLHLTRSIRAASKPPGDSK